MKRSISYNYLKDIQWYYSSDKPQIFPIQNIFSNYRYKMIDNSGTFEYFSQRENMFPIREMTQHIEARLYEVI